MFSLKSKKIPLVFTRKNVAINQKNMTNRPLNETLKVKLTANEHTIYEKAMLKYFLVG